jgi:hypothetical protein
MIRPLQAVNAVHESMNALLASMDVVADAPLAAAGGHAQPSGTEVRD